jgi:signal transduction histidine kinase
MTEGENVDLNDYEDYSVNVKMVTFIVVFMVIVLTLIYFIRIYSNKEAEVKQRMQTEAKLIEAVIGHHLNYSKYIVKIISSSIHDNHSDFDHIREKLDIGFKSNSFNRLFGWRKYSWINENFYEVVSSTRGILKEPRKREFIKDLLDSTMLDEDWYENIVFYTSRLDDKDHSLKLIDSLVDPKTGEYLGSVVLSYDIATMVKSLNYQKKNHSTNFVILDKNYNLVASSKPDIENILNKDGTFSVYMSGVINNLKRSSELKDLPYLDMINGLNYHFQPLQGLPFTIIVNIDNNIIRHNILDSITKKFVEVSIFAVLCLFIIISIYKRETLLRSKAEAASKQAKKATKAKTNFLSFTAHEVRSPLGFILTGSEIMTKQLFGPLPEKYVKYAEGIHQNSQIILDFITDILDENQILEGKFKIVNSFADITAIIKEAIKQNKGRYNNRTLHIKTVFEKNIPKVVCDRHRMLQVFINLISNSIKYSGENVKILISAAMEDDKLAISVTDSGIGMNPEDIRTALSAYGAVESSVKHSVGSYGLGLPIVKMLLDAHDAKLIIESTPNKGTTVKIIFPRYKLVYNGPASDGGSKKGNGSDSR